MRNENGAEPASPTASHGYFGLTKREYFAGLAMAALLPPGIIENKSWKYVAHYAVKAADALLRELDNPQLEPGEPDTPMDPHYTGGKSL